MIGCHEVKENPHNVRHVNHHIGIDPIHRGNQAQKKEEGRGNTFLKNVCFLKKNAFLYLYSVRAHYVCIYVMMS